MRRGSPSAPGTQGFPSLLSSPHLSLAHSHVLTSSSTPVPTSLGEVFSGEQKPGGFTMWQGMEEPSFLPSIPLLIWQIVAVLISNSGFIINITEIFPTTWT